MAVETTQTILPRAEFIEDVGEYMKGRQTETVLNTFQANREKYKMLENELIQGKARLMSKLPEIQKSLDIVEVLIAKDGAEMVLDYELGESVYAKTKVSNVKTINLWLGADVMVEYELEEAKELLQTNLSNCKANIQTVTKDLEVVRNMVTTLEVNIARVWNHDVETRKAAKEKGTGKST